MFLNPINHIYNQTEWMRGFTKIEFVSEKTQMVYVESKSYSMQKT